MKTLLSVIDRTSQMLGRISELVVVLLIASMLYEVVARYVFGAPTLWAFDIAYMSTGALFVLGAAQTLREDAHVRIDVLSSRFPPRLRGAIDGVAFLFLLCPVFAMLARIAGPLSGTFSSPSVTGRKITRSRGPSATHLRNQ